MSDFEIADKIRKRNEGGFANNPVDSGGMTVFGIARNYWPKWSGWKTVDSIIAGLVSPSPYGTGAYRAWVKHLDSLLLANSAFMQSVGNFYKANFWDVNRIGEIVDQEVANKVYDRIVNAGANGAKILQRAIGVTVDGGIGPKTIAKVNSMDAEEVLRLFKEESVNYYENIVASNPSQKQFLKSWLNRC